jgi:hypothetical protein
MAKRGSNQTMLNGNGGGCTVLDTAEDLQWLKEVHGIDFVTKGYILVTVSGNEDRPDFVQCYRTNHYLAVPDIYEYVGDVLTLTVDNSETDRV